MESTMTLKLKSLKKVTKVAAPTERTVTWLVEVTDENLAFIQENTGKADLSLGEMVELSGQVFIKRLSYKDIEATAKAYNGILIIRILKILKSNLLIVVCCVQLSCLVQFVKMLVVKLSLKPLVMFMIQIRSLLRRCIKLQMVSIIFRESHGRRVQRQRTLV
jgi:hypothetical protein